jgi:hypothetical protein
MAYLTAVRHVRHWSKEMMPAVVVLFVTIAFYVYFGDIAFVKGWEEGIYRVLLRFFQFSLFLCLSLYILLPVYTFIVDRLGGKFFQMEQEQELQINPMKHWFFRPFQGIGIGLLFETKLLTALQVVTGITAGPLLFPPGHFQLGRVLVISGITLAVSLLLGILWTLDDMGIRYVNLKDQEVKMIGKYAGTIMPILFGFYGIFRLVSNFPRVQALIYLFKTIVILYPPFVVFAVLHTNFIRRKMAYFSPKGGLKKGRICREEGECQRANLG